MTTTTSTRTLRIDGMTDDASVQRVKSVLKSVQGVVAQTVELGRAVLTCDDPNKCSSALAALRSAGFTSRETSGDDQTTAASQEMTSEGAGGAIGDTAGRRKMAPARMSSSQSRSLPRSPRRAETGERTFMGLFLLIAADLERSARPAPPSCGAGTGLERGDSRRRVSWPRRLSGIILFAAGVSLTVAGINPWNTMADHVGASYTERFARATTWCIMAGIGAGVLGMLMTFTCRGMRGR